MELNMGLALGAVPLALLGASAALAHAYNRLRERYEQNERDRDSYLQVLEGSNDALFVINFVNGRIYQANAQAAQMLGYQREHLVGLTIFELHPREFLHRSAMRIADAWEAKGSIYSDIPLVAANGDLIAVECSARVTSYRGAPAIILFARDIRERIALEHRVQEQQELVLHQNRSMLESIRYAQRIQRAVLPEPEQLQELFAESFILFRPRDIVSGDLYWFAERNGRVVVAAADCTGHGVPGALLSLIGVSLFQEAVQEKGLTRPSAILECLRDGMVSALNKQDSDTDQRDGMNVSLISLDRTAGKLEYSGAFGPLYLIRQGDLLEYKGDRIPVGYEDGVQRPFTATHIEVLPGDRIYLFTDGLQDQFGGPLGKKLKSSGLKQWLLETSSLAMDDQHQALSDRFRMWKGGQEQVDDVLLIGIEV